MEHFEMNLNIWYYLPEKYLKQLPQIFSQLSGWLGSGGYGLDSGFWYSYNIDKSEKYICCHHEPSGLYFSAFIEESEWEDWKKEIKEIASKTLGFKVGEPEVGDCDCSFGSEYANK
ncbi:MAG: hypothetical protein ACJATI_005613 [Halioglobus sp.]|jgi:hypothetical protein